MYRFNESPPQVWQRLLDYAGASKGPNPVSQPVPTPVAIATPIPTPAPEVTPVPETTLASLPAAIPEEAPDPVAFLIGHREAWPKELTLLVPAKFSVVANGVQTGVVDANVGTRLTIVGLEPGFVTVELVTATKRLPMASTDLSARAPDAVKGYLARQQLKDSLAAGRRNVSESTPTRPVKTATGGAAAAPFVHPGLLNTEADFERMRTKVKEGAEPWYSAYKALTTNWTGKQPKWVSHPFKMVVRGGNGENFATFANDVAVAYGSALRWKVTGDKAYADNAVRIYNAWGSTLERIGGDPNFQLVVINGYQFALGAEIMRSYPGWAPADFAAFQAMMKKVFSGMSSDFLHRHMGRGYSFMWSNWDLASMDCLYAVGVLCDDPKLTSEALDFFYNGQGEGNIHRTVYFLHPGYLGQTQEAGRDQGHNTLSMALLAPFCEMAWHQGVDLYGYDNNRVLAGAEYVAKYNLGNDVPFALYANEEGYPSFDLKTEISAYQRGSERPGWEIIYNHYVNRKGLAAPWSAAFATKLRPTAYGGQDQPGFDTLTASLEPIATGANPSGLTTLVTAGQPLLSWWGSAYAVSYNVKRAVTSGGSYTTLATGVKTNTYTDTTAAPGTTYRYAVTAVLSSGAETGASNEAQAVVGTLLHAWLKFDETSGTAAADSTNHDWTGTLANGADWTTGKLGNAVNLTGGSSRYISLPTGVVSDLSDFTIATWIYLNSVGKQARIFDFGTGTECYMYLTAQDDKGNVRFGITGCGHNGEQILTGSDPLPKGQWVHVAVTLNGSAGTLYVNGAVVGQNTSVAFSPTRLGSTTNNWIGRSQFGRDSYLDGKLDDFRIYRGALTAIEVATLVTAGNRPNG